MICNDNIFFHPLICATKFSTNFFMMLIYWIAFEEIYIYT